MFLWLFSLDCSDISEVLDSNSDDNFEEGTNDCRVSKCNKFCVLIHLSTFTMPSHPILYYLVTSVNTTDFESDSEVWMEDDDGIEAIVETVRPESPPGNDIEMENEIESKHLYAWIIKFLAHLQSVFHLSDAVMEHIIKFLAAFLVVLGRFAPICSSISDRFPQSLNQFYVNCGAQPVFCKYVACRKCHNIYSLSSCIEGHVMELIRQQKYALFKSFLITLIQE